MALMLIKMVKVLIYIKYIKKYVLFARLGVDSLKPQQNKKDAK